MAKPIAAVDNLRANFNEVRPDMKPKEAQEEANRCLYCYDAPCIQACPTGINIPSFIKKIATGNLKGAARVIMDSNPVGASCARVCPTSELCEGACVLNDASTSILIGDLQRHATNWAIRNQAVLFQAGPSNGKKIAIIGGGPAGLSSARELARLGYAVTLYEAKEHAGGLNTYGIVSFRLPQEVSLWEVEQVEKLGVTIQTGVTVGRDIMAEELLGNYDAIVLAVGMSSVPNLGIPGENLQGVYDAIDFIEETKTGPLSNHLVGKKVAVVGAGNTAIDAATCSVRLGAANVKMLYRRTVNEMTAYDFEYEFAKQDGVEFRWLTQPVRIVGDENGNVKGIECTRMELKLAEGGGRPVPSPIAGSEFILEVDAVIKAIGQTRHQSLIDLFGLQHKNGVVAIDAETRQTSNPKVFAAGDVVFGGGQGEAMVVSAAQQGKQAAYAIDQLFNELTGGDAE